MSTSHHVSRNLRFLSGFPARHRQLAERTLRDREERRRRANDARRRKAEAIVDAACRRVHDLVGAEARPLLRELMRRERLAFRALSQPPPGLRLDHRKASDARVRKANAFLRTHGISRAELRAIGRETQAQLDELLPTAEENVVPGYHLEQHLEAWQALSPLNKIALPWGEIGPVGPVEDPHRWVLFRPPFFGFYFAFEPVTSDNFRVDRTHVLHPPAGLVGHDATMDVDDPDDIDYASAQVDTEIAFAFQAPTTGLVEVLIDAQSVDAVHELATEDRWGWSDSWTSQINYLMLDVLHPNVIEPSLAEMSRFYLETDDDTFNHRENLTRGAHYFAQLFSAGPVQAGQHVVVLAGTRTFDKCFANDVEIHSRSSFQWFISSVAVRIAP